MVVQLDCSRCQDVVTGIKIVVIRDDYLSNSFSIWSALGKSTSFSR